MEGIRGTREYWGVGDNNRIREGQRKPCSGDKNERGGREETPERAKTCIGGKEKQRERWRGKGEEQ